MAKDDWNLMAAAERADHLRDAFKEVLVRQDGVVVRQDKILANIAKINGRISGLEERTARIEKVIAARI